MININIIDEIINCGISSEDKILQFGVGYKDAEFLNALTDYWGITPSDLTNVIGVDTDEKLVSKLSDKFSGLEFNQVSMQEYLDTFNGENVDWTLITGLFDEYLYEENQHNFVFETINRCLDISETGVIFTLKTKISDHFVYDPIFIFAKLIITYSQVFVKKIEDDQYVFCILN